MDRIALKAICAYAELFGYEKEPFMTVYSYYNRWRAAIQIDSHSSDSHESAYRLCTLLLQQRKNRVKHV